MTREAVATPPPPFMKISGSASVYGIRMVFYRKTTVDPSERRKLLQLSDAPNENSLRIPPRKNKLNN